MKFFQGIVFSILFSLPVILMGAPLSSDVTLENRELAKQSSDEKIYTVSQILFKYDKNHPQYIPIEKLETIEISLYSVKDVLFGSDQNQENARQVTIDEINNASGITRISDSALTKILKSVLAYFNVHGIDWTVVYIPSSEIAENGDDVRPHGDTTLTLVISTPVVNRTSVRFVNADNPSKEIDNPRLSQKICDHFPVSLPDPSTGYPGGFINSNLLDNYLHLLNRHRERRVDLEIGPTEVPGEVASDFIVTQKRPYHFYFNANNNVPKPLHRWQQSVGFIHTQISGNDDVFKVNASTDSFDQFYSFDASYEAPIGSSFRNRWQIFGGYSRFISAEFALPQNLFIGTQAIGNLEFISNIAQWHKLFLDFVANLQYRHIHNRGHFLFGSATKNFLLPGIALKAIQLKRESKLIASLSLQSTISSLFWDVRKRLDNLGRRHLSPNWGILQAGFYGSTYLEPLFHDIKKVKRLANEIVVVLQLQNAFNQRLIPQLTGVLGGLYTIRGYPQSTIAGDNLYMGSIEYRFHLPGAFKPDPNARTKLFKRPFRWAPPEPRGQADWDLVFKAFYDVGETTVNQRRRFERDHFIMGAGLGAELILWQNLFIRGEWGRAFRSANGISKGHNQFYFSSTIIF
jgi:hemolysin activation/secretion protein